MRLRPLVLRLAYAILAAVQLVAPLAASLVDARPSARALVERAVTHLEEPGSAHALAHEEHCVLCSAATNLAAQPAHAMALGDEGVPDWPPRATWLAHRAGGATNATRSRAPPV